MSGDKLADKAGLEGGVFLGAYIRLVRLHDFEVARRVEMKRQVSETLGYFLEHAPVRRLGVGLPPPRRFYDEIENRFACASGFRDNGIIIFRLRRARIAHRIKAIQVF